MAHASGFTGLFRLFYTLEKLWLISLPVDLLFPQSLLPYVSLNWNVRILFFT
jgi:hypothetical protein